MNKRGSLILSYRLTASFCAVIILGLIGYFHTVDVLQRSTLHNQRTDEIIQAGISETKDVALASQEMSASTTNFVYSGYAAYQGTQRQSNEAAGLAFVNLERTLALLPHNVKLLRLTQTARKQNEDVCAPLEENVMRLAAMGKRRQAQAVFTSRYAASQERLNQDISALVACLHQYQDMSEWAEANAAQDAVIGGWTIQALIMAISLLVACRMSRATSTGITQVIQAEETARRSNEMLRLIMDNIPQRIFWKDTDSVYVGCNRNFAAVAGINDPKHILGKTDSDLLWDGEERERLRAGDRRVMDSDRAECRVLVSALGPNGQQSWAETNRIPLHDAEGRVVGILGTVEDITERRQAEEAQRESEALLRTVIASIPVIVFALDPLGRFTFCDGQGLEAIGLRPDQMLGHSMHEVYSDTPALLEHLHVALTGVPHTWTVDVKGRTHETHSMPLYDAAGGLTGLVGAAYDVTEHKRLEYQLSHQAFHDSLTGLPNRALFRDRLEQALLRAHRSHMSVAVLFIDLDNFKVVNDSLGHQTGDQLLLTVAELLTSCLREGDTLARLGGDEFTILLEDIAGLDAATQIADRIGVALREPVVVAGHSLFVSASIGVTMTDPLKSLVSGDYSVDSEAERLLRDADIAMYQAKNGGKANWVIFDHQMIDHVIERMELETEMRHVLHTEESEYGRLVLYYQPIVCLTTGNVREIEALIRWDHPRRGLLPPAKFIPLAEATGLIVPLGMWVLRQACIEAKRLQSAISADQSLVVGVNLSSRQLEQTDLVEMVAETLRETGLSPQSLKLEITESVMMERAEPILDKLSQLRALGVKLAIDDFGTGYSSMACLHDFPLDTLKIDRSFIEKLNEPDGMAIVQAIVMLAQVLHLQVTCEGIETATQWDQLQSLACDHGQGYFFARPQTSEQLTALLTDEAAAQEGAAVPPGMDYEGFGVTYPRG